MLSKEEHCQSRQHPHPPCPPQDLRPRYAHHQHCHVIHHEESRQKSYCAIPYFGPDLGLDPAEQLPHREHLGDTADKLTHLRCRGEVTHFCLGRAIFIKHDHTLYSPLKVRARRGIEMVDLQICFIKSLVI